MTETAPSEAPLTSAEEVPASVAHKAPAENAVPSRVDFAIVVGRRLLVYGWVLGFARSVRRASVVIGDSVVDLAKHGTVVGRADVAHHFFLPAEDNNHGFYALYDLPEKFSPVDKLKLIATLSSGETGESLWPVLCYDACESSVFEPHAATLNRVLPLLSKHEAKRLREFASPALGSPKEMEVAPSLPSSVRFGIDLCCVLEERIVVVSGWRLDPLNELTQAELRIGNSNFRFLEDAVSFGRPDINPDPTLHGKSNQASLAGFNFVRPIPERDVEEDEASFTFAAGNATEHLNHRVCNVSQEARKEFLSLLSRMEAASALVLIGSVAAVVDSLPDLRALNAMLELVRNSTIERLPLSIQSANPRYALHIDHSIPVAGSGVFLVGWFNASPAASVRVMCHCGSLTFPISDTWTRHARADVTTHLATIGIQLQSHDHGFSCFVPICDGDAPYSLSVQTESGDIRRMRVNVPESAESALQTVRALVNSFNSRHPELGTLLDRHIGPAVEAAWRTRNKPVLKTVVRSYGTGPEHPSASVIVPLYGRHDFAEYQLALFANDPEFREIELIYVVDDPSILGEFSGMCADLYGMYKVPFVVAHCGLNLGFAGANNLGAAVARAEHLLFLNSDVLPKRPMWVGDLLRIYKSLNNPGVLSPKLLYEDGSIQHAGMAFKHHPGWADMWINDHPLKGQSPLGLDGIRKVDAVTAACAMIASGLFSAIGGFSEDYIIGDFEDSDLCLRLLADGRSNYIALDVELFHLERQSQNRVGDISWRTNLTLYNCWLHNSRWAELIAERASSKFDLNA
jgi:GT2 family glycosyltransferase